MPKEKYNGQNIPTKPIEKGVNRNGNNSIPIDKPKIIPPSQNKK